MEDNKDLVTTTETVEEEVKEEEVKEEKVKVEKTFSRDELNKIIATEKAKAIEEERAKINEAQKLSKMKEDERLQYEKEKAESELLELKSALNAKSLKEEAIKIATEKELPISYLDLVDFSKETAESINSKIMSLTEARSKDLESYLNSKLKEKAPKQVQTDTKSDDPFIKGFNSVFNK